MLDTMESMLRTAIRRRWPRATNFAVLDASDLDGRTPARVRAFRVAWKADGLSHVEQLVVKHRVGITVEAEEAALLQALQETRLPVPVLRHTELGEIDSFMVLEHLPGLPFAQALQAAGMRWQISALAFSFARALAQVHALDWTAIAPWMADPEALPEDVVDEQLDALWSDWEERIAQAPSELHQLFNRALSWLDPRRPVEVSLCLNHGSFTPANVLLQDDEVSGIIDWDHALVTDASYDLALLRFDIERLRLNAEDTELFVQAAFGSYLQSSPRSFGNLDFYTAARLLSGALDALQSDDSGGTDGSPDTPSLEELIDGLERAISRRDDGAPWHP